MPHSSCRHFLALKMASRQRAFSDDPPQHGIVDEEIVSGAGEGDEIMEEVEEQEDGYRDRKSVV